MNNSAFKQMPLNIDVSILLSKIKGTDASAVIDRSLVELLLAVRETNSMKAACEKLCLGPRQAQRILKQFTNGSGIQLLTYHGALGTELSEQGIRCIELYSEARHLMTTLVRESGIMNMPLSPLIRIPPVDSEFPTAEMQMQIQVTEQTQPQESMQAQTQKQESNPEKGAPSASSTSPPHKELKR